MRKSFYIPSILLLIIVVSITTVLSGCNKKTDTFASSLIENEDSIGKVEIYQEQEGPTETIIADKEWIDQLLKKLASVKIVKLSKNEDIEFMNEGKKFLEPGLLIVFLYEKEELPSGQFLIWPNGDFYILDLKSMYSSKRTIAYISKEKHTELYEILKEEI